ncbi:hypothetical protein COOONC_16210, partial [Cooperia oncophora]
NGIVQQQFDFSSQSEKEFSAVAMDVTGNNVVLGSFDRIRLFSWSFRRGAWEEENYLDIPNLYEFADRMTRNDIGPHASFGGGDVPPVGDNRMEFL